jgi:serine/threonine protein kinase
MNWLREPDTEPLPGYRLLEPIGNGGFGEVWKCLAPGGILKAIKFVYGNLNDFEVDDGRARQELKALERVKQVRHPFLLSIEQIQEIDGELIIVMELADQNLHECFLEYQQRGLPGIPRDKLLAYLDDAAVGLDYLIEKHGLQHLDVKPRNLFLVADRVKVADFGLVKTLERSSISGLLGGVTPLYAAPETFANKISKHTDQYSLAIVYVELLTGRRPFDGKNIRQLALQHMSAPPDLSMLPEVERDIVGRALAKDPDQRFPSCTAFIRTLAALGRPYYSTPSLEGCSLGNLSVPSFAQLSIPDSSTSTPVLPTGNVSGWSAAPTSITPPTPPSVAGHPGPTRRDERFLEATEPQVEVGVLRPSLMLGIGSFGRRALQEIRRRLTDRLGDASQLPALRFLYLDCDPEGPHKALSASPDAALHTDEILLTPLQPVTQYRRRQLEQILDWLPREKLYSIPRNLQAGGVRAFGRLAFCDHYLRFVARLKREIQMATHPESLAQTSAQTGLTVRDTIPQILIFASLAGGSGGMLLDVGYSVQRILQRLVGGQQARVVAFIYIAAPSDLASPDHELANVVAGLTELHHYADPDVVFSARYGGPDGVRVEGRGLPFTATYLLAMEERSGTAFRRCLARLASYVSNELTTMLGKALDAHRSRPVALGRTPFRTFGVYSLWYPRGLMLRSAAQRLCAQLVRRWGEEGEADCEEAVTKVISRIIDDERLSLTSLEQQGQGEMHSNVVELTNIAEPLRRWVQELEQQWSAVAKTGQGAAWARQVWEQTREWVGWHSPYLSESAVVRSRWHRTLEDAARRQAEAWANETSALIEALADQPGRRLAAVESAFRQIEYWCEKQALLAEQYLDQLTRQLRQAYLDLRDAYDACQEKNGTFSLLGGRGNRALRHFVEQHRQYIHLRLQEWDWEATARFFRLFQVRLQEKRRELEVVRLRLREIVHRLQGEGRSEAAADTPGRLASRWTHTASSGSGGEKTPSGPEGSTESATVRVLFPEGETHWDQAIEHLLAHCSESELKRLEHALGQLVLAPRGGLLSICRVHADLYRLLAGPLIDQTVAFLANLLPTQDVADVAIHQDSGPHTLLSQRLQEYHQLASPVLGASDGEEQTYLVVPGSQAGRELATHLQQIIPGSLCIEVPTPATDILFCREHGGLRLEELVASLLGCIPIYQKACHHILTNPHSRYDVAEWLPLWE